MLLIMKILNTFIGKIVKFNKPPELSIATLKDLSNNNSTECTVVSANLMKKGIDYDGCEFKIIISESEDGLQGAEIIKTDIQLNKDQKEKIIEELENPENFDI